MILHIDCNTFFASCEIATRPELKGKPVVVANVNEAGGGIILALNAQAKSLGLKRGNPVFQVKKRMEESGVVVCPADHHKYRQISSRIMQSVQEQDLVVDFLQYSVDEFFGQLPVEEPDEARHFIELIKNNIFEKTGIPVSCGYAQTYTLAKVATHFAKHFEGYHGVCVLMPENREKALGMLPISEVWGIGRQYRKLMIRLGIDTALDFARMPQGKVQQYFTTAGLNTYKELNGIPSVNLNRSSFQSSISQSRTFAFMIPDLPSLEQEIKKFSAECAHKLRSQNGTCGSITVFIATNRHRDDLLPYQNGVTLKLEHPVSDTPTIAQTALQALRRIFRPGYQYKQAGVILGNIHPQQGSQLDLFSVEEDEKKRRLSKVTDQINKQFGPGTVHFG